VVHRILLDKVAGPPKSQKMILGTHPGILELANR
jgi:hypothetical protein